MQKRRKYKPRPPRTPSLRLHKHSGQGVVTLNGRDHYLGPRGDPETDRKYHALIIEWISGGRVLHPEPKQISVAEVCLAFWKHAEVYYSDGRGGHTTSLNWTREAVRALRAIYGPTSASEFGPVSLKAVRQGWIDKGLSRKTINDYTSECRRIFTWAASEEMIPGSVVHALSSVAGLRRGRSKARETESVKPVLGAHIEAVRPYLSRQINALINLQLLCGARGGELLALRPIDIDTTAEVWIGKPVNHKLRYRGVERQIFFGPKAQKVLREFMVRHPKSFLFSPREAEIERHASAATHRRPNKKPTERKTDRKIGELYTSASYRNAIERACERANVPRWTPHQLRHNSATMIRREYGLEASQLILGHTNMNTTEIYAEADREKAFTIIAEIG